MLAFVTSFRARALAADWEYHVRLLERTLASLLAQTETGIRVVVVCHEVPDVRIRDPRLHFITVAFPLPRREFNDLTVDKVLKISVGARWAIDNGCRFLMYADADDLVSRRLAAFARRRPDANGWYFTDGFVHRYGRPWVLCSPGHHQTCGTCAVVRTDALRFAPDPVYRGELVETLAAAGHNLYSDFMARAGRPLEPLPFPGSIYIQHSDSIATTLPPYDGGAGSALRRRLRAIREVGRRVRRARPVTPSLAREFTIPRGRP